MYLPRTLPTLSLQGVSLSYLLWIRSTFSSSLGRLTTSQFCQMYIRPRTSRNHGSVTDELKLHDRFAEYVGEATWFISHTWSSVFVDTLDAIILFFQAREDAVTAKVWIDLMTTSQHAHASAGPSKSPSWWMEKFKSSIASIGGLLLVVDCWDRPSALRRAW